MQRNYNTSVIFFYISLLMLQQRCEATPHEQREARQTKGPSNSGTTQADVKTLGSQLMAGGQPANQLQSLPAFGGVVSSMPYGRYGGLSYGGSGYSGGPGLGFMGVPLTGGPGIGAGAGNGALQLGNLGGLGYPATANYVGNNLPPFSLNAPDVFTNFMFNGFPQLQNNFGPTAGGANNLDNIVNMANLQSISGSGTPTPLAGAQMQMPQLQLQGQTTQFQPQLGAAYPFPTSFFGQMGGYGPGFQAYQLL